MGSIIQAVVQHSLSPKEILSLPISFNKLNLIGADDNSWEWTASNVGIDFLEKYWKKSPEDYMNKPWGIEDLAILENGKLNLHFYQPHLVSFGNCLKATVYKGNLAIKSEFDEIAKSIALKLKAIDIIIIEDWYYDHAFDFNDTSRSM